MKFSPIWHTLARVTSEKSSARSDKVKVGVLGTGSLGKEHVRIYAELAAAKQVEFIGVYDILTEPARKLADKYKVRAFPSVQELVAAADALSIVTPTTTHFELAKDVLVQHKHVLVEKPMTDNAVQAAELVELSIPFSSIWRVSPRNRSSSKRIVSLLIPPAAQTSAWSSIS